MTMLAHLNNVLLGNKAKFLNFFTHPLAIGFTLLGRNIL